MEEKVFITKKEYEKMKEYKIILEMFYAFGVDNWHAYEDVMEELEKGDE